MLIIVPVISRCWRTPSAGHFSYVAVENAERFGRNDTDALIAIDELHNLGVAVRFADYPDLDPIDPDDRILVSLSFTLARRESMKLGQRVTGGLHAKLRSAVSLASHRTAIAMVRKRPNGGPHTKWQVHPLGRAGPERIHVWRDAWDLLLEDKLTLDEICETLHARGYRYRSGRPFVEVKANGKRKVNKNTLSHIYHNWFYAGWVVSEKAGIPPKTVRGQWQSLVTTEEFEQGLAILARRSRHRVAKRKHDYLLKGLIYVELPDADKLVKLTGSTSNTRRSAVARRTTAFPAVTSTSCAASLMNAYPMP